MPKVWKLQALGIYNKHYKVIIVSMMPICFAIILFQRLPEILPLLLFPQEKLRGDR